MIEGQVCLSIVVPVWGAEYLRTYLDYCLAAQLSFGNLPVLGRGKGHRYIIYTNDEGYAACKAHRLWPQLLECVETEVRRIEQVFQDCTESGRAGKYDVKTACYRKVLTEACQDGSAVLMLNADILLSDCFITEILRLLCEGKRVIEVIGSRGVKASIERNLDHGYRGSSGPIVVSAPDLARMWLDNQHPQLLMHYVEQENEHNFHPSHLFWRVGNEGVIIRGFHVYPIAVRPGFQLAAFKSTIDDDLVALMDVPRAQRQLIQDCSTIFCCELSLPEHEISTSVRRDSIQSIVDFYLGYSRDNLDNLFFPVCVSNSKKMGPEWDLRLQESRLFVEKIVSLIKTELRQREPQIPISAANMTDQKHNSMWERFRRFFTHKY